MYLPHGFRGFGPVSLDCVVPGPVGKLKVTAGSVWWSGARSSCSQRKKGLGPGETLQRLTPSVGHPVLPGLVTIR